MCAFYHFNIATRRGSWGNAKTFEFGHKKMGKETLGIISNGVFWKPEQLSFKHTKQFPERKLFLCRKYKTHTNRMWFKTIVEHFFSGCIMGTLPYTSLFALTCRFYKVFGRYLLFVSGLDWAGFSFWVISWIGLD